mgnify:FL=1
MTEIKINALRNYSFGCRLQRLRWWNGLTQKEFAELIGCSQSSVSMWEHGNCIPYGNILEKIIMLYELPYDFFDDVERS